MHDPDQNEYGLPGWRQWTDEAAAAIEAARPFIVEERSKAIAQARPYLVEGTKRLCTDVVCDQITPGWRDPEFWRIQCRSVDMERQSSLATAVCRAIMEQVK